MSALALSVLLKPFFLLLLMVGVVMPITLVLWRVIPRGKWKQILFDEDLFKRYPGAAMLAVMISFGVIFGIVAYYRY
jgi:hypothetical protein